MQYAAALLMNLSLRTSGKNVFERIGSQALQKISTFLGHEDFQIRSYVNGILYSITSRNSVKVLAKSMGLEKRLIAMRNVS